MEQQHRVIAFVSHDPKKAKEQSGSADYYVFSNWAPSKFVSEDGKQYISTEQFMMEKKALEFGDAETAAQVMAHNYFVEDSDKTWTQSQAQIKALGRKVKKFRS